VLGIERNENRHSAFLAWLLNPDSTHGLKESPLRKFLSLVATKATDSYKCASQEVREHLITSNYSLQVECVKTEQSIIGLANGDTKDFKEFVETDSKGGFKKDAKNRFDIWILLHIKYAGENDVEHNWTIPIVVETKIYSKEGNAGDEAKAQTIRYQKAVNILYPKKDSQPLFVYLARQEIKDKDYPSDPAFILLFYQDILDHVLQPCAILSATQAQSADARVLIDGYIRNLSCPSNRDGENIKDYSILAIAESENNELETIFESNAFKTALHAIYPKEAQTLLDNEENQSGNSSTMMEQFWNVNENLFKIVLYNHFKCDEKKMETVQKIIKVSNRDNTRYLVGLKSGDWLNVNNRPASKSEASFLIFKAYCEIWQQQHPKDTLTIDHLRQTFTTNLNSFYYNRRWLKFLFYDFDEKVVVDVKGNRREGEEITSEDKWNFYWDDIHKLPIEGNVHSVKMWRKDDFEELKKKAESFGIIIEPIE
jgi:hypothetical protein